MRLTRSMSVGAGIGFAMGFAFTVYALLTYDDTRTDAVTVLWTSLAGGLPILVMMGVFAGWLWDVFIRTRK